MAPRKYKKEIASVWNELAPRYHRRVVRPGTGPFESTKKMVSLAKISKGDAVLDMACGTGAVTKVLLDAVGPSGSVTGADISAEALRIAKRQNRRAGFVLCDAESAGFAPASFDAVTCQYGLFFFSDAKRALRGARRWLKRGGTLAAAVHGKNTPFYTGIAPHMAEHIPGFAMPGAPQLDRYCTAGALRAEIASAGFSRAKVRQFTFEYSPGTFGQYWSGYIRYVPKRQRAMIRALPAPELRRIREAALESTKRYAARGGTLSFPWQVLVATASA